MKRCGVADQECKRMHIVLVARACASLCSGPIHSVLRASADHLFEVSTTVAPSSAILEPCSAVAQEGRQAVDSAGACPHHVPGFITYS